MLIIEDGSVVQGANSYVSVDTFSDFLTLRGLEIEEGTEQALLIKAIDVLEQQTFKGNCWDIDQSLAFPRKGIANPDGEFYVVQTIPQVVRNSQMWMAFYLDSTPEIIAPVGPAVTQKTLDVLTQKFAVSDGATTKFHLRNLPNVYAPLKHLLRNGTSGVIRAVRG